MFLKAGLIALITFAACTISIYFFWYKPKFRTSKQDVSLVSIKKSSAIFERLDSKAEILKTFTRKNNYNEGVCFLIDMSIASGKKRFFVFDLQKDSVLLAGLVAHGSCNDGFKTNASFSNKVNSGCSCFGKFKIGNSYPGNFGTAYKIYGLDSSNNNAFKRNIVLHSYTYVPEQETDPLPICNSRGCPMISPGFMEQLKPLINQSKKPIVLWIFE